MKWWFPFMPIITASALKQGDMKCASIFGLETPLGNTDCSWSHPASYYIEALVGRGFNWLRVPFSGEYVRNNNFQIMDEIFHSAEQHNISILLDWHRNVNAQQDTWLQNINIDDYLQLMKNIIARYVSKPQLQAVGLFNEYQSMDAAYWKNQMDRVVKELEATFPNRLVWVIGGYQWSGNHALLDWSYLPFYDRVRYDVHKYIFSIKPGGTDYEGDWLESFPKDHSKVLVGEWGFFSEKPDQVEWAKRFVAWLNQNGIHDNCFWTSVTNSGDTGGLWKQCEFFEEEKFQVIRTLWKPDHRQLNATDLNVIFRGNKNKK